MTSFTWRTFPPGRELPTYVSEHWLKRRYVLTIVPPLPESRRPPPGVEVMFLNGEGCWDRLSGQQVQAIAEVVGTKRMEQRLQCSEVTLVLAVERCSGEPVSFRWLLHPRRATVFHDKVPVQDGVALGFNEFTYPRFRRQGIYRYLIDVGNAYAVEKVHCSRVFIVVEEKNHASLVANARAGYRITGTNLLVKFLGRNVLSLLHDFETGRRSAYNVLCPKWAIVP